MDGTRHCNALHHHRDHTDETDNAKQHTGIEVDIELPQHIVRVLAYPELHRIDSIRKLLTVEKEGRYDQNAMLRHPVPAKIEKREHPVHDSPFLVQARHRHISGFLPKKYKI